MSNGYPFSLVNDEQMSNKVGVKHQPVVYILEHEDFEVFQSLFVGLVEVNDFPFGFRVIFR